MYGPILENFQNTGDLGVKIFITQFYFLGPKNFLELVQNVYRDLFASGPPWSNQIFHY